MVWIRYERLWDANRLYVGGEGFMLSSRAKQGSIYIEMCGCVDVEGYQDEEIHPLYIFIKKWCFMLGFLESQD